LPQTQCFVSFTKISDLRPSGSRLASSFNVTIMRKLTTLSAATLMFALTSTPARADMVSGGISFVVGAVPSPGAPNWATATGIDFVDLNCLFCPPHAGKEGAVQDATGDYTSTIGQFVDFTDFQFSSPSGLTPLWAFSYGATDYSFVLSSVVVTYQTASSIIVDGVGTLFATGFDPAPNALFTFTGNSLGRTFSASASNVPEPTSLAFLCTGAITLAVMLRRRARATAA
jgi:hypothetical protein